MEICAKDVKEKLQNEKNCEFYVYLQGEKFVYDTELKNRCIGKISSLQADKEILPQVKQKDLHDISINDITRVEKFKEYKDIKEVVREVLFDVAPGQKDDILSSSANIIYDIGLDSLDVNDTVMIIQKEMGISIPPFAIETYFKGDNATIGNICQYLHQQVTQALQKAEQ